MEDTAAAFLDCETILKGLTNVMQLDYDIDDKDDDENCSLEVEDFSDEYHVINTELDQMFSALDALEKKNDALFNQLKELLIESREARINKENNDKPQEPQPDPQS